MLLSRELELVKISVLSFIQMEQDMLKQEGYDLMGAVFEVYNVLGYGMAEEIYQQSLEIELGLRNIPYQSKADAK